VLRVERGYVRPEDEPAVPESEPESDATDSGTVEGAAVAGGEPEASPAEPQEEPEDDEVLKPIPDRLMTELTACRTLALRDAVAQNPDVASWQRCMRLPQALLPLHVRFLS
jgi:ParB family chromosome partitioning protein